MTEQVEAIRELVSRLTKASFEKMNPKPEFLAYRQGARWFIHCPYLDELEKTLHVESLWENKNDQIWIQSAPLGDSTRWIEAEHGEEATIEAQKIDFTNFNDSDFRKKFSERFPLVDERLRGYENVVAKVSKKWGVNLRIRYEGGKGIVAFYMDAKIDGSGPSLQSKLEGIELNVKALKEALIEIDRYESKRMREVKRTYPRCL